eukprot:g6521.t1
MRVAWQSIVLLPVLLLPAVVTKAQTCSNGLAGYESAGACCPLECGFCGGDGCSETGKECCASDIEATEVKCSESRAAPCIIDTDTVIEPESETEMTSYSFEYTYSQMCSNGIEGIDVDGMFCCALSCGTCGGRGCAGRPGGSAACCGGGIQRSERLCSETGEAPCIIDDEDLEAQTEETEGTPTSGVAVTPTLSPVPLMTIPTSCESGTVPTFRYASTSGKVEKGRLYAESEGCFTMTDLYNWRGTVSSGGVDSNKGPIYQLDDEGSIVDNPGPIGSPVTNKWLLAAELYVTNGAIFYCKGTNAGGDCDELRIQSNGPDDWYEVRGHGGSMYFEDTIVTSWDTDNEAPQEEYEGGRSFLNCVSEKLTGETCDGMAKNEMGECRMDIINSEIGYLGWFDSESYGLTWKVRGFCKDLSNPDVFETTNVYGDIINSDIHHNYYGHYSYGHQGGVWINNKMHHNHQYGFDPHDDSDYLTIAGNDVYNNVNHGIIASKRCNNVKIYDNIVYNGGDEAVGIFLHRSSDGAEVYDNTIYNMKDAGIAMLESMDADIHDNIIDDVRYGIRMSLGSAGNNVYDNTFNSCTEYGLYTYEGSDEPTEGVSDGRPSDNTFDSNEITDTPVGVKFKSSDNLIVSNNVFTGTQELEFFDAQDTQWSGNTLPESGVCVDNVTSDDGNDITESTFEGSDGLPSDC